MNNFDDLMKSIKYELNLKELNEEIMIELSNEEIYDKYLDVIYDNKLRDIQLINDIREKIDIMTNLIYKINELELKVIDIKDTDLLLKCECKKARLINMIEYFNNKYMM